MKYGVHSFIWTADFGLSDAALLPRLKEAGFDGVELPLFQPATYPAKEIRRAEIELPQGTHDTGTPPGPASGSASLPPWKTLGDQVAYHRNAVDHRFVAGRFDQLGPATDWVRLRVPVIAGESALIANERFTPRLIADTRYSDREYRTANTQAGADILKVAPQKYSSTVAYPASKVAQKLKGVAQVHLADLGTRHRPTVAAH